MRLRMAAAVAALIALVLVTIAWPPRDSAPADAAQADPYDSDPELLAIAPPPDDGPLPGSSIRRAALMVQPVTGSTTGPIAGSTVRIPPRVVPPAELVPPPVREPEAGSVARRPPRNQPEAGSVTRRPPRKQPEAGATVKPRLPIPAEAGSLAKKLAPVALRAKIRLTQEAGSSSPVVERGVPVPLAVAGDKLLRGPEAVAWQLPRYVAFGPGGHQLAVGDAAGNITLYDVPARRRLRQFKTGPGRLIDLLFTPDGNLLTSSAGPAIELFDTATGEVARTYRPEVMFNVIALTPQGDSLIGGSSVGRVMRLALTTGEVTDLGQHAGGGVIGVAVSPDGRLAVTSGHDSTVRLWNVNGGGEPQQLPRMVASCLAFSPDGTRLALAGSSAQSQVWRLDPHQGHALERKIVSVRQANGMFFDRTARHLFISSGYAHVNISRINLQTGDVAPFTHNLAPASIRDMALAPDGLAVAAVTGDAEAHLFQLHPDTSASIAYAKLPREAAAP